MPQLFLLTQYEYKPILYYLKTYVNSGYLKFNNVYYKQKARVISFLDITRALFRLCVLNKHLHW